jgi:DsbC/DsbD-like thiol-disulfide interchange protein
MALPVQKKPAGSDQFCVAPAHTKMSTARACGKPSGTRNKGMNAKKSAVTALCLLLFQAIPAGASSSSWFDTEGGRIRLVTAGTPTGDGVLRAALQIDLEPGWKTYWRDPGDAGVPPQITFTPESHVQAVETGFPAPQRFDQGAAAWAGYQQPVSLALTLHLAPGEIPALIEADVFLGVCQTICIPVQAKLTVDPRRNVDDMFDRATVNAAFDSLPEPASAGFGVTATQIEGKTLRIGTAADGAGDRTLFLAGEGGYAFGEPQRAADGTSFTVPVLAEPVGATSASTTIRYTLIAGDGAVEGAFPLP